MTQRDADERLEQTAENDPIKNNTQKKDLKIKGLF